VGLNNGHGLGQLEFVSQQHIWQPPQHEILQCVFVEKVMQLPPNAQEVPQKTWIYVAGAEHEHCHCHH
jgi:hypothetical protein